MADLNHTTKKQLWEAQRNMAVEKMAAEHDRDEAIANRDRCHAKNGELGEQVFNLTNEKQLLLTDVERMKKEVKELTDLSVKLRGEKEAEERYSQRISRELRKAEGERDRARAALVEANINASRLVEAVEPRNTASTC